MERQEPCIICSKPTNTGFTLVGGTPELVAAALTLIGVPQEQAEKSQPMNLVTWRCFCVSTAPRVAITSRRPLHSPRSLSRRFDGSALHGSCTNRESD